MKVKLALFLVCLAAFGSAIAQGPQSKAHPKITALIFSQLANSPDGILHSSPFRKASRQTGKPFEAFEGAEIGLTKGFQYGIRDYTDPFWFGRGTASGDYNKDGWQDIIFGGDQGFFLYKNVGGRFELQQQPNPELSKLQVFAVAFVDLNNDGWLDIFFTTFNKGNFLILSDQGAFDYAHLRPVPNQNAVLTLSPAFADLDLNGQPDILNGNVALGVVTGFYHMQGRRNNSVVFNDDLNFRDAEMETTSGETMASLISDINNDDIPDIYFGNDFMVPDKLLLGTGDGYKQVTGNQFIPYTPFFSMGADSGDINNDLSLDFIITGTMYMAPFVGQSAIDGKSVAEYSQFKGGVDTCASIKDTDYRNNCIRVRGSNYIEALDMNRYADVGACQALTDNVQKDVCLTEIMWKLITLNEKIEDCAARFGADGKIRQVCEILKLKGNRYEKRDLYGAIPQDDRNMLYTFDVASKSFKLVDEFRHPGGWTWNSKIVDLDNDGWQDVITSDGTIRKDGYGWNSLMKNIDGKRFEQQQFRAGLASDFGLYSFTLVDFDNDGDLDIIGNSAEGPVQVYRNNSTKKNHSLAISLVDHAGNYNGIGAKITIRYNKNSQAQIREVKASGGYMSFDPAIAYFGLGKQTRVDEIRVLWPDRTQSTYTGPFQSDRHIRIERVNAAASVR